MFSTLISTLQSNHHIVSAITYYLNVSVSVITSVPVPGELQDGVSIILLSSNQEPVLAWINGR